MEGLQKLLRPSNKSAQPSISWATPRKRAIMTGPLGEAISPPRATSLSSLLLRPLRAPRPRQARARRGHGIAMALRPAMAASGAGVRERDQGAGPGARETGLTDRRGLFLKTGARSNEGSNELALVIALLRPRSLTTTCALSCLQVFATSSACCA